MLGSSYLGMPLLFLIYIKAEGVLVAVRAKLLIFTDAIKIAY